MDAEVNQESLTDIKSYLSEILPDTRKYDGCQEVDIYFDAENEANMVLVETWDSRKHHEKYLNWRSETGVLDELGAMLNNPPNIQYLEKIET